MTDEQIERCIELIKEMLAQVIDGVPQPVASGGERRNGKKPRVSGDEGPSEQG
jgi:hypothetical protein